MNAPIALLFLPLFVGDATAEGGGGGGGGGVEPEEMGILHDSSSGCMSEKQLLQLCLIKL